jgi:uncharacterized protein (TIGR03083 family)
MPTLEERKAALRSDLVEAQTALLAALDRVPPDDWGEPSPNEGWTVLSLLIHLSTSERGFVGTIRRQAGGQGGVVQDFDPDRWNASQQRRRADATPAELRAELEAAHAEMLALLDELDEAALAQRGHMTTGGDGSVEDQFRLVARHKRAHTGDLLAALD